MLRRLACTAVASLAALSAAAPAVAQEAAPAPRLPLAEQDHLTVTVSDTGTEEDGTYQLECGRDGSFGGTHHRAEAACERLGQLAEENEDPFAPVPADSLCTMQHGGAGTAHVTGVWQGRPVDASYDRSGGCEIGRWNTMVPVLPEFAGGRGSEAAEGGAGDGLGGGLGGPLGLR
ncbi:SSI family serine proteinase inhibitor [Streptomyces sp. B-S-A6]|uniref:SSI family serine proteinase inhibitor n=1 Tax=Streptomyces cavernicola TaxID=3043613 RepID=A0ABT6S3J3_9ACTN|nr:SSI family serine proteinase inhibitor [Streptomyces sp. B-S-A6]MDI3402666.1 SSI family serine proteinase inhibitor [Streptomyces sp. B-S-A6]